MFHPSFTYPFILPLLGQRTLLSLVFLLYEQFLRFSFPIELSDINFYLFVIINAQTIKLLSFDLQSPNKTYRFLSIGVNTNHTLSTSCKLD